MSKRDLKNLDSRNIINLPRRQQSKRESVEEAEEGKNKVKSDQEEEVTEN
jgi:hypothetical protein